MEDLPALFCFTAVPEAPRNFPEGSPEAYLAAVVLHGSRKVPGRFPEDRPEAKRTFDISSKPMQVVCFGSTCRGLSPGLDL